MQALILAGGRGTRMRPLTDKIPKVLLPVGGRPFLFYLINFLKTQGVKEFILAVGYKAQKIKDYFGNGEKFGVKIVYSEEKKPLGTGGALKNAEKFIKHRDIFVLNGDIFIDVNIKKMTEFHKRMKLPITIGVCWVNDISRYGRVAINKKNVIMKFEEKEYIKEEGFINGGIYLINKKIIKDLPSNRNISLEKELFPQLIGQMAAFKIKGYFIDIGIPQDYQKFQEDVKNIKIWN